MCKAYDCKLRAIETAKRTTPEVYAVYEEYDGTPDLVGIVAVLNRTVAKLYDVNRLGELELYKTIPNYAGMSNRALARMFDLTTMYRVTSC